jgi:hypothetical protein
VAGEKRLPNGTSGKDRPRNQSIHNGLEQTVADRYLQVLGIQFYFPVTLADGRSVFAGSSAEKRANNRDRVQPRQLI